MKRLSLTLLSLILLPFLIGSTCEGGGSESGGGGGQSAPTVAHLAIVRLLPSTPAGAVGEPFFVDVLLNTDLKVLPQAYDLTFSVDASRLRINGAVVSPAFSDDGEFFLSAASGDGDNNILRIVDAKDALQEGTGEVHVATVELEFLTDGPKVPIVITGRVASTNGLDHEFLATEQSARAK